MVWLSILATAQAISELSLNGMMIVYLIQPYREVEGDEKMVVNQAVRAIAGQDQAAILETVEEQSFLIDA